MKRLIPALAVLALASPLVAQEDYQHGEVELGALQRDASTISSKFLEYRDIPQGAVVPLIRFQGKKGDFRYDIWGRDITQRDQRLGLFADNGTFRLKGSYVGIPHSFGNGGNSLLRPTQENAYLLSDTLQQAFQTQLEAGLPGGVSYDSLLALVSPSLEAAPSNIDLKLNRDRSSLAFSVSPKEAPYDIGITYQHERRSGTRAANGTSFGFSNVVETPEPLRYITQDLGVNLSFTGTWGVARASLHLNDFKNAFNTFTWDNPFRYYDSTSGSAYTAPSNNTIDGATQGLMALAPDNKAYTGSVGATLKLGDRTRLTADLAIGSWKQDETPLIPYTSNTAILTPEGEEAATAPLPVSTLGGKIDTMSLNGLFTTRLTDDLTLTARFRRYDNDNKTPRVRFEEGYVRFDAVWEEFPRITVPYGFTNNLFDAKAVYNLGDVSLEAGYKYSKRDRTYRETENTTEKGFRFAADFRANEWVLVRGLFEKTRRDYDSYTTLSLSCGAPADPSCEDTSFIEPEPVSNQTTLRRSDLAQRDVKRFGGTIQLSPGDKVGVFVSYMKNKEDYDQDPVPFELEPGSESPLGLRNSDYATFNVEGDFTPSDRASFYAFYTREDIDQFLAGRQSGASLSFDPADGWTSAVADKVDSFGAGADFVLQPEKWDLNVFARWQKADGNNAFTAGANRGTPEDIPLYDDTKLLHVRGQLQYHISPSWAAIAGAFYEDYKIEDAQTIGTLNYMPGSFFLATNNGDYDAWVAWLTLKYNW